jgi:hypothetical protein
MMFKRVVIVRKNVSMFSGIQHQRILTTLFVLIKNMPVKDELNKAKYTINYKVSGQQT